MSALSSTVAWKAPSTEEPGVLPSMGSQRVRRDGAGAYPTAPQKASGRVERLGRGAGAARGNPPGEGTPELSAVN